MNFRSLLTYLLLSALMLYGCAEQEPQKHYDHPVVIVQTKFGNIKMELYPEKAPATVAGFLTNVDSGYYKDCAFYRVLRDDNQVSGALHAQLIQGGIWVTNYKLKAKMKPIPHESTKESGLLHKRGTVSLARAEPGTATSEFFICLEDEPGFDFGGENNADGLGYAPFGKVLEGMEVVKKIHEQPEYKQRFRPLVTILDVKRAK